MTNYEFQPDAYDNPDCYIGNEDDGIYICYCVSECAKFFKIDVVVNSETGSFIETLENAEYPISQLLAVVNDWIDFAYDWVSENGVELTDEDIQENELQVEGVLMTVKTEPAYVNIQG